ncbi:hypothetical protein BDR26DRAFT_860798 [Obelidium mucronatum]|nr:hypothetical protein BDR26DRAFT_860798 [Obelidium mucronatum]
MSQILSSLGGLIGLGGPATTATAAPTKTAVVPPPQTTVTVVTTTAAIVPTKDVASTTIPEVVQTAEVPVAGEQTVKPGLPAKPTIPVSSSLAQPTATTIPNSESTSSSTAKPWLVPVSIVGSLILLCIVGTYITNICLRSKNSKTRRLNRGMTLRQSLRRPSTSVENHLTAVVTPSSTPNPVSKEQFTTIPRRSHRGSDASVHTFNSNRQFQTPPPIAPQQVYVATVPYQQQQQQQQYYAYPQQQQFDQYGYPVAMTVAPYPNQGQYTSYENVYGYAAHQQQQPPPQYRRGSE